MKNFFRHWHYGIKARVTDGALVAYLDSAREPAFVRLDLTRLQTVAVDVAAKPGEYELNLVNIGAAQGTIGATTTLARFEVKDAAEEAAAGIRCALLRGSQTHRFRRAFKTTMGVLAALTLAGLLFALLEKLDGGTMAASGNPDQAKLQSMIQSLQGAANGLQTSAGPAAIPVPPVAPGQPMSAEQFLNSGAGGDNTAAPAQ